MASKVRATKDQEDRKDIDELKPPKDAEESDGKLKPGPNTESFKLAAFWKGQIDQYDKAASRWHTRGNTVLKRYRDERNKLNEEGQRKMNLLWANIKVMKPAIYSKCPDPIVDRKFLDHDPIGRLSSTILERSLKNEQPNGYHRAVTAAVYDRLLPGRGTVWLRYEPEIGEGKSISSENPTGLDQELYQIGKDTGDKRLYGEEDEEGEQLEETGSRVLSEKVVYDYVNWTDYYELPAKARTRAEIQAIGKKTYCSRKEVIERFGEKIGKAMQPDTTILADTSQKSTGYSDTALFRDINERSIVVIEVWNKSDRRVYWFSPGYEYLCDVQEDPLELKEFFPARVINATTTNDSLIPVPDYWEWQDQAIQIDELTTRIASLTKACKIAGVYDASQPAINRIFNESVENKLIPVDQWAAHAEKGGLKGVIDFLPLDEIQKCIETLQNVRQACMQDLDQVTGLSDIVRGTSDSRETLGGIRLKNNNAGTRLSESQEDVACFCRDLIALSAEILCKHFSDETLIQSSGILYEEELQPDVVMRDYYANKDSQTILLQPPTSGASPQPQGQGMPNQPGQAHPALPAPNAQPGQPSHPPMPGSQPGMVGPMPNAMHPPMPGQPPQQPGSNVIPMRPGMPTMPGQGPGSSLQQGGQQPPSPLMPQPIPQPPPDPQVLIMLKVQQALKLLRDDLERGYRVDIETDSTIYGDKVQDRQDATEFVTAMGTYMSGMETVGQTIPEAAPLLAKVLQWSVRKYRTGRDLENEVDNFAIAMQKKAKLAAMNPQAQNPEAQKAQVEIQKAHMDMQNEQQKNQMETQRAQMEFGFKERSEQAKSQREGQKMQSEQALEQQRHQLEVEKMNLEMQLMRMKHQMEMQKLQGDLQVKSAEVGLKQQDMQNQQQMQHADMQMQSQEHGLHMQEAQQEHAHKLEQGERESQMQHESHQLEKESLQHKAKAEEKSHGLKMEQHKMKQQAMKAQPKKGAK